MGYVNIGRNLRLQDVGYSAQEMHGVAVWAARGSGWSTPRRPHRAACNRALILPACRWSAANSDFASFFFAGEPVTSSSTPPGDPFMPDPSPSGALDGV